MNPTSFYEEITGEKYVPMCYETEQNKVKELIRFAKKSQCHGTEIFQLSSPIRDWLEEEGFTVVREKEIFYKCCNDDEFNHCECFLCRNAGKETGTHVWKISWPKKAKK